jgi:hypothetical protein
MIPLPVHEPDMLLKGLTAASAWACAAAGGPNKAPASRTPANAPSFDPLDGESTEFGPIRLTKRSIHLAWIP